MQSRRELELAAELDHIIFLYRSGDIPRSSVETWRKLHGGFYTDFYRDEFIKKTTDNRQMKRSYGGSFYPQPRQLVRVSNPVYRTAAQNERARRMRALAMRKRGMRPFLSANRFPEIKAVDNNNLATGDAIGQTAIITPLNLIQVGSGFYQRVGRKIEMKSLTIKGISATLRTVVNESIGRILVIYDRQTNGALPAIADILQGTDQTGANVTSAYSGINLNYRDRFLILKDEKFYLPSLTDTAGVITNLGLHDNTQQFPMFKCHLKLKNLETMFRADTSPAVIGDIATGGLYLVVMGSLTSASTGWSFFWESRLRYGDK